MSRLHFKGEFSEKIKNEIFYKYCPDTIYEKETRGKFKFNIDDWKPVITFVAEPTGKEVYYTDEQCVNALTYKIRKHFEEYKEFQKEIFYIA